ncbi:MAG TPA: hypothetical protein VMV23_09595 [Candidatus Nanopelagicaceae bacterium]|nr:hypothetical protein [Candidatus Nanopelagicaceae bacterium]
MSWHDRSLLVVGPGGFLNQFAASLVIGFFPVYFLQRGLSLLQVGRAVGGYAVGPLVLGGVALAFGLAAAFWAIVFLMGLSEPSLSLIDAGDRAQPAPAGPGLAGPSRMDLRSGRRAGRLPLSARLTGLQIATAELGSGAGEFLGQTHLPEAVTS